MRLKFRRRCGDSGEHTRPAVGLWVTESGVTTGQSLVTARVAAKFAEVGFAKFVLTAGLSRRALVAWLNAVVKLIREVAGMRMRVLYLVCSRSNAGFLRDLPAYLARRAGVRVVVHVHGSDIIDLMTRPGIGAISRWAIGGCTLVVPSSHLVEPLCRIGVSECYVCENFVSELAAPPEDPPRENDAQFVVLWNSNVMASKGFFLVADAVAQLHAEGMHIRFIALGAPLADEMLSAADCSTQLNKLIAEPWFDYRGPVNRAGAFQALLAADVVCLPSRYASECQPLALIEAMCAGKRLLIADTPALRATVRDYPCEVVTTFDTESIVYSLRRCGELWPAGLQESIQLAKRHARKRFSPERFDRELYEILKIESKPAPFGSTSKAPPAQ